MIRFDTTASPWEAATDPRAPLGLRRVSRRRPQPTVARRQDRGVVWALRGLAIASGAGLCCLSSDQDLDTIIVGGVGLLSVLGISLATLDWLAGGTRRRQVELAVMELMQALHILFAVVVMPIAWPLSRWLQRRQARRGGTRP